MRTLQGSVKITRNCGLHLAQSSHDPRTHTIINKKIRCTEITYIQIDRDENNYVIPLY